MRDVSKSEAGAPRALAVARHLAARLLEEEAQGPGRRFADCRPHAHGRGGGRRHRALQRRAIELWRRMPLSTANTWVSITTV